MSETTKHVMWSRVGITIAQICIFPTIFNFRLSIVTYIDMNIVDIYVTSLLQGIVVPNYSI